MNYYIKFIILPKAESRDILTTLSSFPEFSERFTIIPFSHTAKNTVIHLISWCVICAFPQNFHTRKLGEITVFYAVTNTCLPENFSKLDVFRFDHLVN